MAKRKTRLPEDLSAAVKSVLKENTPAQVARRWGMDPDTLARVVAGYEVQAGTVAQVRLGLLQEGRLSGSELLPVAAG